MNNTVQFPAQQKSFKQKGVEWRKQCVDWGVNNTYFESSAVRMTVTNMKINQDLIDGKIHIKDIERTINPTGTKSDYIPDNIQHYPIINSKLNVLQGEEGKRIFDWKAVVTNPNSISQIENAKKNELMNRLTELIQDNSISDDEFNSELEKMNYFFTYQWQDIREMRANALLTHYDKEINFPIMFNKGIMDAMTFGEECYQVDIVGGEPTLEKINPMRMRVFRSSYSDRIEDADAIVLEDYWSPGKIIDRYYDSLTPKDIKKIEEMSTKFDYGSVDETGHYDERANFVGRGLVSDSLDTDPYFYLDYLGEGRYSKDMMPFDTLGNIRVVRVYWKSKRKIKKIKSYDSDGNVTYTFYPENYITKTELGEEEKIYWINEAWEGTLIGKDIYVNMRPRVIQYNRLSNPSRCHFGIIGSIYNKNDGRPFSMVDMMKPYSYYYDAVHDRLNKKMERNWGKMVNLDLAKIPSTWDIDKWMYYAKVNGIAVYDSFKEGNHGMATGKLAGSLNNASNGSIDADLGNSIQSDIQLLQFIKGEMAEVAGISPQREGQVSNRETVGGVERATLQSSHITEWLFTIHDDLKKRVMEAFIETAKIALKGRKKKFQYILSDGMQTMVDIDGDEFAESDYGIIVDNSNNTQKLSQQIDSLAQAAIQNQYSLSTIMKLYTSTSLMEKIRILEYEENSRKEEAQRQQQQQMQIQQQEIQQKADTEKMKSEQEYKMHQEDNETKILVAEINSKAEADRLALMNDDDGIEAMSETDRAKIKENVRQFDEKMKLERQKLELEKKKAEDEKKLRAKQINSRK